MSGCMITSKAKYNIFGEKFFAPQLGPLKIKKKTPLILASEANNSVAIYRNFTLCA